MTRTEIEKFAHSDYTGDSVIAITFKDDSTDSVDPVWEIGIVDDELQVDNGAHKYGFVISDIKHIESRKLA